MWGCTYPNAYWNSSNTMGKTPYVTISVTCTDSDSSAADCRTTDGSHLGANARNQVNLGAPSTCASWSSGTSPSGSSSSYPSGTSTMSCEDGCRQYTPPGMTVDQCIANYCGSSGGSYSSSSSDGSTSSTPSSCPSNKWYFAAAVKADGSTIAVTCDTTGCRDSAGVDVTGQISTWGSSTCVSAGDGLFHAIGTFFRSLVAGF